MENEIHFTRQVDELGDIVLDEIKIGILREVLNVAHITGQKIIQSDYLVIL